MDNEISTLISKTDNYSQILHEICAEQGIRIDELSDGWIKLMVHGSERHFVVGYDVGLNSAASVALASSKTDAYNILSVAGIPAVLHQVFYSPENHEPYARGHNSPDLLVNFFQKYHSSIVLKPNGGMTGRQVYHITDKDQIATAVKQILSPHYWHNASPAIAASPYHEIQHEYRVIMLDNEPKFVYQKSLTATSDWKFNLSQGAVAERVTEDDLLATLTNMAGSAMKALDLRFASVDIIKLVSGELLVLEVNSGVSVNGYLKQHPDDYAEFKEIFAEAVAKVFAQK